MERIKMELLEDELALLATPGMGYLVLVREELREQVFDELGMSPLYSEFWAHVVAFRERRLEVCLMSCVNLVVVDDDDLGVVPAGLSAETDWDLFLGNESFNIDLGDGRVRNVDEFHLGDHRFNGLGKKRVDALESETVVSAVLEDTVGVAAVGIPSSLQIQDQGGYCYLDLFVDGEFQAAEALGSYPTLASVLGHARGIGVAVDAWVQMMPSIAGTQRYRTHVTGHYVPGAVRFAQLAEKVGATTLASELVVGGSEPPGVGELRFGSLPWRIVPDADGASDLTLSASVQFATAVHQAIIGKFRTSRTLSLSAGPFVLDKMLLDAIEAGKQAEGLRERKKSWSAMSSLYKVWHVVHRVVDLLRGVDHVGDGGLGIAVMVSQFSADYVETETSVASVNCGVLQHVGRCVVYFPRGCVVQSQGFVLDTTDCSAVVFVRSSWEYTIVSARKGQVVDVAYVKWLPWLDAYWQQSEFVPDSKSCVARLFRDVGVAVTLIRVPWSGVSLGKAVSGYVDDYRGAVSRALVSLSDGLTCAGDDVCIAVSPMFTVDVDCRSWDVRDRSGDYLFCGGIKLASNVVFGVLGTVKAVVRCADGVKDVVRVCTVVGDEYTFDGGGPSGSDFSEGY